MSSSEIDLSWGASSVSKGRGLIQNYTVYRNGVVVGNNVPASQLNFNDTGLTPSTGYTYQVSATTSDGVISPLSSPVSATTLSVLTAYTVSPSGSNVTISPNSPQSVNAGATKSFTVAANSGYSLSSTVGGTCPMGGWSGSTYTTGAINANCSVGFSATATATANPPTPPPPQTQIITPTVISGIIKNPGIGYQTFYQSAASDRQLPSSTMYIRFDWSQVESAPGIFNFSVIDNALASAQSAGQRLAFRIMGYEDGNYGPVGLKNVGFPGYSFAFDGYSGVYFPDLTQAIVQQDMSKLIAALGQKYGNNPAIDSVDIGFVGDWGEFHFWNTSPTPPFPSTSSLDTLTNDFLANFKVPIIVGGDLEGKDITAFNYAIQNNVGWRVDCWGNYASGWNHMQDAYPAILADAPNAWQKAPVVLEPCGVMSDWVSSGYPWQLAVQWAIDNHASQFSNKSAAIPSVMLSSVQDMLTKIGYRFVLTQAQLPTAVTAGSSVPMTLNWSNVGNSPMYFDRHVLVKIGSQITDTGISMKGFLPGTRIDTPSVSTQGLTAGTYTVQIGLAAPGSQTPDINLAIQGSGPWYTLGTISVQ